MRHNYLRHLLLAVLIGMGIAAAGRGQETAAGAEIKSQADHLEFDEKTNWLTATGNVRIEYDGIVVEADEVRLNRQTKDFEATGNVKLTRGDFVWKTGHIQGNLEAETFVHGKHEATMGIWHLLGEEAEAREDGTIVVREVRMSTCPDWSLYARSVEFQRDRDFIARKVRYEAFGQTVFYLPYVTGNTEEMAKPLGLSLGYDDDFGGTLGIEKEFELHDNLSATLLADYRTKRGFGLGTEVDWYGPGQSSSDWLLYGMLDDDPPHDKTIAGTDYQDRFESEEERFRISGYHRQDLNEQWVARAHIEALSDPWLREEFWRDEWERDPQPASYAAVEGDYRRLQLGISWRPRVNDFQSVVARSPELRLSMPRQQVFETPLYYENRNSAAYLEMMWRDADLPRPGWTDPADYETTRLDSLHVVTLPLGWNEFSIVPRLAGRATWYEDSSRRGITDSMLERNFTLDDLYGEPGAAGNATNYDELGGDRLRWAWETGVEISTRFYRTWPGARSRSWQIDGLRHVVEPYVNYTYIPEVTEHRDRLYYFDDVDRVAESNFGRVGVRQRVQTRREGKLHTLARIENYVDLHVDPVDDGPTMGDFGNRLDLAINPYVDVWARALIDSDEWRWNVMDSGMRLGHVDEVNMTVNYLWRNDYTSRYTDSMGSDLSRVFHDYLIRSSYMQTHDLSLGFHLPVNDKTTFRAHYYLDLEEGELATQTYELTRQFRCWVVAAKVEQDVDDWAVMFVVYMKDMPGMRLGGGI